MNAVKKAVGAVYAARKIAAALALLFFAAAYLVVSRADFRENIFDILPVRDGVIDAHIYAGKHFGQSNTLYFNVASSDENVSPEDAADALAAELKSIVGIKSVTSGAASESFQEDIEKLIDSYPSMFDARAAAELETLLEPQALDARMEFFRRKLSGFEAFAFKDILLKDPVGILNLFYGTLKESNDNFDFAKLSGGKITDADGRNYMILAEADFDSSDSAKSALLVEKVASAIARVTEKRPAAQIAWAGGYRISADNAKIARADSVICLSATLALMLLICLAAFRNRFYAVAAIVPSLFGTSVAFCILVLTQPHISTLAIAFASIAIGVSIDYAIHILYRMDAHAECGLDMAENVAAALARPICVVSGTTIIAFAIMYFSGSAGFRQLGMFGAAGVFFSALASVFVLPAFVVGFRTKRRARRLFDILGDFIERFGRNRERMFAAVAVLISLAALPFALRLGFDGNISSFNGLEPSTKADDAKMRGLWGGALSKTFAVVRGKSFDEAKENNAKLAEFLNKREDVEAFGLRGMLPPKETASENIARWNGFFSEPKLAQIRERLGESAAKAGFGKNIFSEISFGGKYAPVSEENLNSSPFNAILKGRVSAEDGDFAILTQIKPLSENFSAADFSAELSQNIPEASYIDMRFFGEHISREALYWMLKFAAIAFALVALYLLAVLRRPSLVAAVLTPVLLGLLWCFAIMGAFDIPINIVNSIFVIFAVCLAQDYAVFMLYERGDKSLREGALGAVLLSAFTTIAAFGTLAFATHPVLRSLGLAAALSIFTILCACIFTVPVFAAAIFGKDSNADR